MPDPDQRPTPDPTVLTTEQLERAVGNLKELLQSEIKREEVLCTEKFNSVDEKLRLIERQRVEQKSDTEKAVSAALSAAKEAVAEQTAASEARTEKSETATIKSIDQLGEKFDTAFEGVRREMSDLKERTGKIESRREGGKEEVATHGDVQARLIATAAALAGIAAVIIAASG